MATAPVSSQPDSNVRVYAAIRETYRGVGGTRWLDERVYITDSTNRLLDSHTFQVFSAKNAWLKGKDLFLVVPEPGEDISSGGRKPCHISDQMIQTGAVALLATREGYVAPSVFDSTILPHPHNWMGNLITCAEDMSPKEVASLLSGFDEACAAYTPKAYVLSLAYEMDQSVVRDIAKRMRHLADAWEARMLEQVTEQRNAALREHGEAPTLEQFLKQRRR